MWLNRIAPIMMNQMVPNQGRFRKGSGAREQLWTLSEFLEERMVNNRGSVFYTTDAHRAFDQATIRCSEKARPICCTGMASEGRC